MKKYLLLFLLLIAACAALIPLAHSTLTPMEEDLELRETVHQGDKSAAEGITLSFRLKSADDTLYWDAAFLPAADVPLAATEMSYYPHGREETRQQEVSFSIDAVSTGFGLGAVDVEAALEGMYYDCMVLPALDLAGRTPEGEKKTEIMRVADYYQFYPLTMYLYGFSFEGMKEQTYYASSDSYEMLTEYFSIPVPEDEYVEVTVDNTEPYSGRSGVSTSFNVNCNSAEGSPSYSLDQNYVVTDKGVYVQLCLEDISTGEPAEETAELSRQIHLIPLVERYQGFAADMENISLFYELEDPRDRILHLQRLNEHLLVFTEENHELWLTSVDMESGKTLQHLYLLTFSETEELEQVVMEENFLLTETADGLFRVVETRGETLVPALSGTLPEGFRACYDYSYRERKTYYHGSYDRAAHFAWDGRRLVLAGFRSTFDTEGGLHLAVMDETGLVFLASYATFIDWETVNQSRIVYRPSDYNAVSIQLT